MAVLSSDNPLFLVYITWSGILIVKTLLMSLLTCFHRRKHGVSEFIRSCCVYVGFYTKIPSLN